MIILKAKRVREEQTKAKASHDDQNDEDERRTEEEEEEGWETRLLSNFYCRQ